MNARQLLDILTLDDYEKIFYDLGVKEIRKSSEYWIIPTICHNIEASDASYKLYFYLDTRTTFCFTECNKSRDIFDLIADRWRLIGNQNFTFTTIINYICEVCGIKNDKSNSDKVFTQPAWKKRLSVYNVSKKSLYLGKRYDKTILRYLEPCNAKEFLNDGISKLTMEKFGIGYYPPKNQITIPVYDLDGQLIGIHCRNLDKERVKRAKYIPMKTVGGLDYRFKSHEVLYGLNMNQPIIQKKKQIQLFESPKSVLQLDTMYGNHSTAVAMFGMNLGKQRRDLILQQGISEVIIGIDKDYNSTDAKEFQTYLSNVNKIAKLFKGFCRVSVFYDDTNLLDYKESPTDKGKDAYESLLANRRVVKV